MHPSLTPDLSPDRSPGPGTAPGSGADRAAERARRAAGAAAGGLAGVVAFQAAVAAGAPLGRWTQGGGTDGRLAAPGRVVAVVSTAVLTVMALGLLARTGQGPAAGAPRRVVDVVAWATTVYLGLGVALNLATPSPRERALWAPVTTVLFALALVVVLGTRGAPRRA